MSRTERPDRRGRAVQIAGLLEASNAAQGCAARASTLAQAMPQQPTRSSQGQ